ncbi:19114_t:CDS:2, partial [Racocetra persica]
ITNTLHKYEINPECAPIIEINGFKMKDKAIYLNILENCPEHETKYSFERRSWHHYPPYEEFRSIFDVPDKLNDQNIIVKEKVIIKNQIDDEPIIFLSNAIILLNEDAKPGITYVRVYSKK